MQFQHLFGIIIQIYCQNKKEFWHFKTTTHTHPPKKGTSEALMKRAAAPMHDFMGAHVTVLILAHSAGPRFAGGTLPGRPRWDLSWAWAVRLLSTDSENASFSGLPRGQYCFTVRVEAAKASGPKQPRQPCWGREWVSLSVALLPPCLVPECNSLRLASCFFTSYSHSPFLSCSNTHKQLSPSDLQHSSLNTFFYSLQI